MVSLTLLNTFNEKFTQLLTNFQNLYITSRFSALNESVYALNVKAAQGVDVFSYISTINFFVNNLFYILVLGGLVFFSLSYGAKVVANNLSGVDLYQTSFNYFADLEEELGSADDGLFYFLIFGLIIVWFFFFTVFSGFLKNSLSWIISILFVASLTAFIVPAFVLKNFGLAAVMYVRGSGRTTSLLFEAMLDFVSVAVIMIRFLIQNIRFVFIFSAFFELYEFIYDKLYYDSVLGLTNQLWAFSVNNYTYWYEHVGHFILQWVLYLYYLGHLTLLFIAQLSIYFALSFWLFFFLYTTFTLESSEKYFLYKRLNN